MKPSFFPCARRTLLAGLTFLALSATSAAQVPLPQVDLGATSFNDGIGGPGLFLQEILEPFHAGSFRAPDGSRLPGNNTVDTFAAITEVAYTTRHKMLGAWYGGEILLPIVHLDVQTDLGVRGTRNGVGDLIFSPFLLQWPEHKIFGKSVFQRLHVIEMVIPTGQYDRNAAVNIGSNVVSLGPHYAVTVLLMPKLETSWRFHYVWNSSNNNPAPAFNVISVQPGQAFHFNATVSYKLHPRLRAGVAGYCLKQITDAKIGGHAVPDSREQVGAIGPGLWFSTKAFEVYSHAFFETGAENRPQGTRLVFRLVKIFPAK